MLSLIHNHPLGCQPHPAATRSIRPNAMSSGRVHRGEAAPEAGIDTGQFLRRVGLEVTQCRARFGQVSRAVPAQYRVEPDELVAVGDGI